MELLVNLVMKMINSDQSIDANTFWIKVSAINGSIHKYKFTTFIFFESITKILPRKYIRKSMQKQQVLPIMSNEQQNVFSRYKIINRYLLNFIPCYFFQNVSLFYILLTTRLSTSFDPVQRAAFAVFLT